MGGFCAGQAGDPSHEKQQGLGGHLFTQTPLLGKPRTQSALTCAHSVGAHLCAFPGLLSGARVLCRVGPTLPWGGLEGRLDVGVPFPQRLASVLGGWGPSPPTPPLPGSLSGQAAGWAVAPHPVSPSH